MQEITKREHRDAAARAAAASDRRQERPAEGTNEGFDLVLGALAERIGQDASLDPAEYLLRSDTAHDGE